MVAISAAGLLFFGQVLLYLRGNTTHSLTLSRSTSIPLVPLETSKLFYKYAEKNTGQLSLKIHLTFPHVPCEMLDVVHDGVSLLGSEMDKVQPHQRKHSISLRKASKSEMVLALGQAETKPIRTELYGCTVTGRMSVPIVAGVLAVSLNRQAWAAATTTLSIGLGSGGANEMVKQALRPYNVSHYIHAIDFGTPFSRQTYQPLQKVRHAIDNDFYGLAVVQTLVKLVPTVHHHGLWLHHEHTYQTSVVDLTIQPQTLVAQGVQQLPGLVLSYDFTPLTVHQSDGRDNILVFVSSLISIVGGVFVTVGMLTGCLVHSAQAVAKKMD